MFQIVQDSLYLSCVNLHYEPVILKANLDQTFKYEKLSYRNVSVKYKVQRMAAAAGKNVTVCF